MKLFGQRDKNEEQDLKKIRKILKSQRKRLDNLYYITDEKGQVIKFKMNWVQRIVYLSLWYMNIILKSRQHGITTFSCIFFLDTCLFNSNTNALIIAHNKDDAEEFFRNKVKFAYDRLPSIIRDSIPANTKRANQIVFSNGSSIRVSTSGRSGTYQLVHISEHGKICAKYPHKATEIKTGTLNATHPGQIVVIESTAEGREGDFYDYCMEAQKLLEAEKELTALDFKFFFFPWFKNPLNVLSNEDAKRVVFYQHNLEYFKKLRVKYGIELNLNQRAFYAKKLAQQGEEYMWQEFPSTPEEAFRVAIKGAYFKTQMIDARKEGRICSVPYQEGILVNTWWDIGFGDTNAIWFTQNIGREIHVIDYYENSGEGLQHYADVLNEKEYRYGQWWAPHDIMVHEYTSGKTRKKIAEDMGIPFRVGKQVGKESQIENSRKIFKVCIFDEVKCDQGLKALESYRKEWDEKRGCYRNTPLHDWASNGADAFHTFSCNHHWGSLFADSAAFGEMRERAARKKNSRGWT